MSHTFLDAVNETLKRVNVLTVTGTLSSFTNSAIQHNIDIAQQVINEGIDELYSANNSVELPGEGAESTITLATGTREYALASDLITLIFDDQHPLIDRTNNQYIRPFPGGYNDMLLYDTQQNFTGLPFYGTISPITSKFRVERAPTSAENGRVYYYEYEKNLVLSNTTDAIPFNDACFRAMVPAWVQLYKREMRNEFDGDLFRQSIGRASRFLTEIPQRTTYNPRAARLGLGPDWPF